MKIYQGHLVWKQKLLGTRRVFSRVTYLFDSFPVGGNGSPFIILLQTYIKVTSASYKFIIKHFFINTLSQFSWIILEEIKI